MGSMVQFLDGGFDSREDAVEARNNYAKTLVSTGHVDKYSVAVRPIAGTGTWGVYLFVDDDRPQR